LEEYYKMKESTFVLYEDMDISLAQKINLNLKEAKDCERSYKSLVLNLKESRQNCISSVVWIK